MKLNHDLKGFLIADTALNASELADGISGIQRDIGAILRLLKGPLRDTILRRARADCCPTIPRAATQSDASQPAPARARDAKGRFLPAATAMASAVGRNGKSSLQRVARQDMAGDAGIVTAAIGRSRDSNGRFMATGQAATQEPELARAVRSLTRLQAAQIGQAAQSQRAQTAQRRTGQGGKPANPAQEPAQRDAKGRFLAAARGGDIEGMVKSRWNGLLSRLKRAAISGAGSESDLDKVAPAIEAAGELKSLVAGPLQGVSAVGKAVIGRGFNPEGKGRSVPWYRRIFSELRGMRREESAFAKAQAKTLKEIERRTGVVEGGNGKKSFWGALLGTLGPLLLCGLASIGGMLGASVGPALAAIFSPLGAAIVTAAGAAWVLLTESGQKAFRDFSIAIGRLVADAIKPLTDWLRDKLPKLGKAKAPESTALPTPKNTDPTGYRTDKGSLERRRILQQQYDAVKNDPAKVAYSASKKKELHALDAQIKMPMSVTVSGMKTGGATDRFMQHGGAIVDAARRVGIDPAHFTQVVGIESAGFQANAKARDSSAAGLGQFIAGTWADVVVRKGANHPETASLVADARYALKTYHTRKGFNEKAALADPRLKPFFAARTDPAMAALMSAEYQKEGMAKLEKAGVTNPTAGEMYSTYFTGNAKLAAAARVNPGMSLNEAVRKGILTEKAINGNLSVFKGGTTGSALAELSKRVASYKPYGEAAQQMTTAQSAPPPVRPTNALPSMPAITSQTAAAAPGLSPPPLKVPSALVLPHSAPAPAPVAVIPVPLHSKRPATMVIADHTPVGQDLKERRLAHIPIGTWPNSVNRVNVFTH